MFKNAVALCEKTRPTGRPPLFLFLALTAAYVTTSVLVFEAGWLRPTVAATSGWIDAALLCSAAALTVIVGGVIFGVARLTPADVGLHVAMLPPALLTTAALWLLAQIAALVINLVATGTIAVHGAWSARGASWVAGGLIGQLLGNAPFEEIAYRGFLLPQLYLKLGARGTSSPKVRLAAAVLLSQSFFALMHVPIRLHQGTAIGALPLNLLATVAVGVFFCWIYLQTGNLFVAVGVHALVNNPTPLVECALEPQLLLLILLVPALLLWPRLPTRLRPVASYGPSPQSLTSQSSTSHSSSQNSSSNHSSSSYSPSRTNQSSSSQSS